MNLSYQAFFSSECKPIFMNLLWRKSVCGQLGIILLFFNLGKSICDRLFEVFFLQIGRASCRERVFRAV